MSDLSRFPWQALLGAALIGFVLFGKWSELRARKQAVRVRARVVKVFSHRHVTSYFVRYTWQGAERTAEYQGPPLRTQFAEGDTLEILIDPARSPDVAIPDAPHDAPNAALTGGTCSLAGAPLWSVWDGLYLVAGIVLIVRSYK